MGQTLTVACRCGAVTGRLEEVAPSTTSRVRCCCNDCQGYARRLGREDVLDDHGGSDVIQVSPARFTIEQGHEHLRALQQTPKGAMRFYASCCNSPVANTLPSPKGAFMGVFRAAVNATDEDVDAAVGPIRATFNRTFEGDAAKAVRARGVDRFLMVGGFAPKYLWWSMRGDYKASPFYDAGTRSWRVEPERVYEGE